MVTADNASTQLSGADKTPSINNICYGGLSGPAAFGAYPQLLLHARALMQHSLV